MPILSRAVGTNNLISDLIQIILILNFRRLNTLRIMYQIIVEKTMGSKNGHLQFLLVPPFQQFIIIISWHIDPSGCAVFFWIFLFPHGLHFVCYKWSMLYIFKICNQNTWVGRNLLDHLVQIITLHKWVGKKEKKRKFL